MGIESVWPDKKQLLSVVVPVFNEAANIGAFCREARKLPGDFEVLVVYDSREDTSLPVLAALTPEERPARVRARLRAGRRFPSSSRAPA